MKKLIVISSVFLVSCSTSRKVNCSCNSYKEKVLKWSGELNEGLITKDEFYDLISAENEMDGNYILFRSLKKLQDVGKCQ